MDNAIIIAMITGCCSVVGVIISNISSNRKVEQSLQTSQAVTDTKIEALTEEVKKHNDFASRVPILEEKVKVINHRIDDLSKKVG